MAGTIGCPDTRVEVRRLDRFDQAGEPVPPSLDGYYVLSGIVNGTYYRTYNAWGPFEITVAGSSFCDNILPRLQPNWSEVRIIRGSDVAYTGTVRTIEQRTGLQGAVIRGGDIVSEFAPDGGRLINLVDMQYQDTDPVDIAADVILQMMDLTSPEDIYLIRDYLYTNPVGETIDYAPGITADYLIETLDDLANYGLLFAAVGRRIILSSVADLDRDPVAQLTTADFDGAASVIQTSEDMGVYGVAVRDGDPPDVFTYGDFGSPWGAPGIRVDVDEGVSDRSALNAARRAVQSRTRPRYHLQMPSAARLKPTAPIELRNVRPGSARVDVSIRDVPVPVRQPMMLTEAQFGFAPGRDEVRVKTAPIGPPVPIPP